MHRSGSLLYINMRFKFIVSENKNSLECVLFVCVFSVLFRRTLSGSHHKSLLTLAVFTPCWGGEALVCTGIPELAVRTLREGRLPYPWRHLRTGDKGRAAATPRKHPRHLHDVTVGYTTRSRTKRICVEKHSRPARTFIYTVKPAFKTTWEIGTTWGLRTATPVPRPIQYCYGRYYSPPGSFE